MIACAWDGAGVTGNAVACPAPPAWRRHEGGGDCWEHPHTLYCDEHARTVAPRSQFTPITDVEGIYQHDGTHQRIHRTAPRGD